MEVFHVPAEARRWVNDMRTGRAPGEDPPPRDSPLGDAIADDSPSAGATVGVVPTMGALHDGHLSLLRAARERCDHTVAWIFVNPTQFAAGEDLDRYPRTLTDDLDRLRDAGADAVLVPPLDAIYPEGFSTHVEPPRVAQRWEGDLRPGHFRGVCTVVLKLFGILPGTHAFFGRKDYQQWRVIEAMVRDLDVAIEVVACDTAREPDGLAMSSRNRYLQPSDRRRALAIYESLREAQAAVAAGETDVAKLEASIRRRLTGQTTNEIPADNPNAGVDRVDYAAIVDPESLEPIETITREAVALIAARLGETRLIDNLSLQPRPRTDP